MGKKRKDETGMDGREVKADLGGDTNFQFFFLLDGT
jgi:hypothetical protein